MGEDSGNNGKRRRLVAFKALSEKIEGIV